ncbi:hypothetical protein Trydic_g11678 [Trypoxylus dichotomus]
MNQTSHNRFCQIKIIRRRIKKKNGHKSNECTQKNQRPIGRNIRQRGRGGYRHMNSGATQNLITNELDKYMTDIEVLDNEITK